MLARIIALMVVAASVADARPGEPLVLVNTDAAFASALDDALIPAGMTVVAVGSAAAPGIADLPARSRELADQQHASATVWLLSATAGMTLVTYDRQLDRLLVRELPYHAPLSATQAAEAARMVRTMLRALRVSNDSDVAPPPSVPSLPPGPPEPWLAASVGLGAWFASPGTGSAFAAIVEAAWRPHGLGGSLSGMFAPSADLMAVTFDGRASDRVIAGSVHQALFVTPQLRITPSAGLALHIVELEGSFGGATMYSRRLDPAARLGASVGYPLPRGLDVGVSVSADCLLRRQRYAAGTEEVLVVPRLQIITSLVVGIRL